MKKMVHYDSIFAEKEIANGVCTSPSIILSLVKDCSVVADFGCSTGYFAKYLSDNRYCKVYCYDINEEAIRRAKAFCYQAEVLDLNQENLIGRLTSEMFDFILFPAVLEHLVHPDKVLDSVKKRLDTSGKIIVSIPNVAHISIRASLFFGKFEYKEYGILDKTHLRFYTEKTARKLIKDSGLKLEKIFFSYSFPFGSYIKKYKILGRIARMLFYPFRRLFGEEIILVCSK